jgi:hypothetical protein
MAPNIDDVERGLARRHLDESQRAMIAAKIATLARPANLPLYQRKSTVRLLMPSGKKLRADLRPPD